MFFVPLQVVPANKTPVYDWFKKNNIKEEFLEHIKKLLHDSDKDCHIKKKSNEILRCYENSH